MPPYEDVYVLAPGRTVEVIDRFLSRFAPNRAESAAEYEIPYLGDVPVHLFRVDRDLISYCLANSHERHAVYWRCLGEGDPAHAMAFFTDDEGLILGLSVTEGTGETWLAELKESVGSLVGCVRWEESPPGNAAEFRAWTAAAPNPPLQRT